MSPRAAWRLESLGFSEVYDYVAGKVDWGAAGLPREGTAAGEPTAGDAADATVPTCHLSDQLADVRERVCAAGWDTCIVVNEQRVVLGRLGRRALSCGQGSVEDEMSSGPSTVRPSLHLSSLHDRMRNENLTSVIVTTFDGRLVGVVRFDVAPGCLAMD
jgi:Mg/Co/Ni transporter MgtE